MYAALTCGEDVVLYPKRSVIFVQALRRLTSSIPPSLLTSLRNLQRSKSLRSMTGICALESPCCKWNMLSCSRKLIFALDAASIELSLCNLVRKRNDSVSSSKGICHPSGGTILQIPYFFASGAMDSMYAMGSRNSSGVGRYAGQVGRSKRRASSVGPGSLGAEVRTEWMSNGGLTTWGFLSGLRDTDGPAGGGGGGTNEVAAGADATAVGVPARSILFIASTLDLRCERPPASGSSLTVGAGWEPTSGKVRHVTKVGFRFLVSDFGRDADAGVDGFWGFSLDALPDIERVDLAGVCGWGCCCFVGERRLLVLRLSVDKGGDGPFGTGVEEPVAAAAGATSSMAMVARLGGLVLVSYASAWGVEPGLGNVVKSEESAAAAG